MKTHEPFVTDFKTASHWHRRFLNSNETTDGMHPDVFHTVTLMHLLYQFKFKSLPTTGAYSNRLNLQYEPSLLKIAPFGWRK